jgi:hypothetical protein
MTLLRLFSALTLGTVLLTQGPAVARSESHTTTTEFKEVSEIIADAVQAYGANRVLLALDIDNTTMETPQDLGSEHWFLWQSKLITENNFKDGTVARNIPDLLFLQSLIIHQSKMRPVEARIPLDLQKFGKQGVKMMALTSRDMNTHDSTERELSRNGFPYAAYAPGPKNGFSGTFKPYDLRHLEDSGLTESDVENFQLKEPSDVSYEHGIFLTAGQHKGIMLRTLLAKIGQDFDAVIFIDDRLKHSEGMQAAFADEDVSLRTIQYTHTAKKIEKFHAGDKAQAKADWCEFAKGLSAIQGSSPMVPFISCQ